MPKRSKIEREYESFAANIRKITKKEIEKIDKEVEEIGKEAEKIGEEIESSLTEKRIKSKKSDTA